MALFFSPVARAQDDTGENRKASIPAITTSTRSVDFGYRANEVNGNQDTYDTFINLGPGVRLFDYTLEMRSLEPSGIALR